MNLLLNLPRFAVCAKFVFSVPCQRSSFGFVRFLKVVCWERLVKCVGNCDSNGFGKKTIGFAGASERAFALLLNN